jgi:membrane peptidoglycan carboxypeptidase
MGVNVSAQPPRRRRRRRLRAAASRGPRWWRELSPRWRLAIRLAVAATGAICLFLVAIVAYAAMTLPSIDDIGRRTGTIRILDRNGQTIAELGHDNVSRTDVPLDRIAKVMQQATIAAEDRNFYKEGAFDIPRIVKALFVDVLARRPEQGASTITQQLAKQAFFIGNGGANRSFLRKLREAMIAYELDRRYTKDQILDKYLNVIYYGDGAYGVENAAEVFFGKHAADLDLMEASLLAGLPQAPAYNDPHSNPQAAFARQHYVLSGMVAIGAITQAEMDAVDPLAADPVVARQHQQAILADLRNGKPEAVVGPAPHFAQYVRDQVNQLFHDDPALLDGNLIVQTPLDLTIQAKAQAAVSQGIDRIGHGANNGALLMLDARTGDVVAFVGSKDFNDAAIGGQFDVVTAMRRPGSSFKPYVYETAFKEGVLRPDSILQDTAAESAKLGGVQDFDHRFLGPITAARALLLSRNVPAEQAMVIAGIDKVIAFAHSLGITSDLAPNASTAIGTSAVRMIEHAAAYVAFADGGRLYPPRAILRVTDDRGHVLFDAGPARPSAQVMTSAQAWAINRILVNYPGVWGLPFRHETAGKSGTTDNFVDAWYMSYTPNFVVATWAGHTEAANPAEQGMDGVYGTTVGKAITVPFVNGLPASWFTPFRPVTGALADCSAGDADLLTQAANGCPTPVVTTTSSTTETTTSTTTVSTASSATSSPALPLPTLSPLPPTHRPTPGPPPTPSPTPTPSGSGQGGPPTPGPAG